MKHLVIAPETVMVAVGSGRALAFEQVLDPLARLPVEGFTGAPHDGDFDGLADEPRLHHLRDRDFDDRRPALRQDLYQIRLGEGDQGLADRLPGDAKAVGQILLRETRAGRQLEVDDGPPKLALDA